MPSITYTQPDGRTETVEVDSGTSVMRAAIELGIDGIVGECGGQAMCATCHVYVEHAASLPPLDDAEEEMLECTASDRLETSRLGCQLRAGLHFDEISVRLPEVQV